MKVFEIGKNIKIVCDWNKTRYGFRHTATLFKGGVELIKGKCCYYNRTWERYEYQSVLYEVVDKAFKNNLLSKEDKVLCDNLIKEGKQALKEVEDNFKSVGAIAKLGDLFCDNQQDKNDWKKRMLKAGLGNKGLSFPDDWNTLSEAEKEKRLNGVINEIV